MGQQTSSRVQDVAARLRAELAEQKISQVELGQRIGRDQRWVSRRVTGEVEIGIGEMQSIADALGVPLAQLLATSGAS